MSTFNDDKSTQILFDLSSIDSNSDKNPKFDDESANNDDKIPGANVNKPGLDSNSKDDTNPDLSNKNQNLFSSSPALINIQSDMISTTATAALPSSTTVVNPKFEDNDDSVGNILRVTTTISKSVDIFDKDDSDKDSLRPSPDETTTTTTVAAAEAETTTTTTPKTTETKTTASKITTAITTTAIITTTTTTILETDPSSIDNPVQSGLSIPGQPINNLDSKISLATTTATSTTASTTTKVVTASDDAFYDQDSSTSDPTTTTKKKKRRPTTTTTTTTVSTASDDYDIEATSESTTTTTITTTTRKKQRRRTTTTTTANPITSSDGAYYDIDPYESTPSTTATPSTIPYPTRPPKFVPEFGSTNSGKDVDDSNEKRGVVELKPQPQGELGSISNFGNRNPNLENRNPNVDNRYPGDKNHRFVNNMNFDVSGIF